MANVLPVCCGNQMKVKNEGIRFFEVECKKCGDVVYVKKPEDMIPQLIDD